jgi:HSP20 family protein
MKIMKAAPVLAKVREDIDEVFDRIFRTALGPEVMHRATAGGQSAWLPAYDLLETEAEFVVRLDIPGAHRENLDLNLVGTVLTITGRREFPAVESDERYLMAEREWGEFRRMIRLPAPVDPEQVNATYQQGVLLVTLPKVPSAASNTILIK